MPTEYQDNEALRQAFYQLETTKVDLSWVSARQDREELKKRYRELEKPCYDFVAALRDAGLVRLLAEHGQLESVPSLRPFPFRVPQLGQKQGLVKIWSPGAAQAGLRRRRW